MRNLKKFLALVLAMAMAFSLMLSASAANPVKTFDDADQITEAFVEAADVLVGMKIFQGDDRGFAPGATITRAETAALIYRLATGDTGDTRKDLYKDYGNFKDVNSGDWFAGYVGYCANAGYIKGHNGYFNPYGQVTGYEALAMILRAVGYDKNHEFEGATWQTNVSALATQLGILKVVKSTDYGDRLYEPSRRDVVASLLFEAAQIPMVEYTQIGGYNKFTNLVNNELNPSLGYKWFGLAHTTRIVLGNQETGEDYTKLGAEKDGTIAFIPTAGGTSSASYTMYTYPGTVLKASATAPATTDDIVVPASVGIEMNIETDLELFGHKVKFWYDATDTGAKGVYAYFDKATVAEYVYATNGDITSTANANNAVGLRTAANGAGFANTADTRWSWKYSQIQPTKTNVSTNIAGWMTASPNNTYYLVSNNDDKTVDVAVVLSNELAKIEKKDTTSTTKSLTLGDRNTSRASAFGYGIAANSPVNGVAQNDATLGVIAESRLTKNSVKDLNAIVLATEILGTTDDVSTRNGAKGKWMYKLETPKTIENSISSSAYTTSVGGSAWTDDTGNAIEITLSNGTTLKRSGIMDGQTSTQIKMIHSCVTELDRTNMIFGQPLTIYLDKVGRFVGVSRGTDYSFLYATFGDYEIGGLGTGAIKYAVTGVNWDGEIVENHALTSISARFGDNNPYTYRNDTLAYGYNADWTFGITRKYQGDNLGGNASYGNQIKPGVSTGFIIDAAGNLRNSDSVNATTATLDNALTLGAATIPSTNDAHTADARLTLNDKTFARAVSTGNTNWDVTAADAANGFADVSDTGVGHAQNGGLLLTDDTKFIVVSGHGTSDLKVEQYTGLTEFLNGSTLVEIDPACTAGHVYYRTTADLYNNVNTTNNNIVERVIMPVEAISGRSTNNLYFSNSRVPTGTTLNGEYEQYVMYNNGEKGYYFIEQANNSTSATLTSVVKGSGNEANTIAKDAFYTLTQTKTVNGQPVYTARIVTKNASGMDYDRTNNGICWTQNEVDAGATTEPTALHYSYVSTNNLSTGRFGGTYGALANSVYPVTGGVTYRVDNAKVVDLSGQTVPHAEFKSVLDLNNAISSGWKINDVAIVNDGINVSVIYVLDIVASPNTTT